MIEPVRIAGANTRADRGPSMDDLKAPFPYFGGKRRVTELVWQRLGDCVNVIEPFCGSAAFLLRRPHPPRIETLNDENCYVANFWRATQEAPHAVADHADAPVNEADLHARHRWLVLSPAAADFRERMRTDPDYFDAKVAGWWCWGACCWIGSGWCDTAASSEWEQKPYLGAKNAGGRGINPDKIPSKRPLLAGPANDQGERTHYGLGVHAKGPGLSQQRPNLNGTAGGAISNCGVHNAPWSDARRPQLADAYARGRGVHGNDSAGTCADRRAWLLDWFNRLRDRLRTVRVCCGDWQRVCDSPSVTTRLGLTGIFLDPPYPTHVDGKESRAGNLYASDSAGKDEVDKLRDRVLAYCKERGPDPLMRIAVCGYDTDGYAELESLGWSPVAWKASGGYGNRTDKGKANAGRERIWFSPACQPPPPPPRRKTDPLPGQMILLPMDAP